MPLYIWESENRRTAWKGRLRDRALMEGSGSGPTVEPAGNWIEEMHKLSSRGTQKDNGVHGANS